MQSSACCPDWPLALQPPADCTRKWQEEENKVQSLNHLGNGIKDIAVEQVEKLLDVKEQIAEKISGGTGRKPTEAQCGISNT